MNFAHPLLLLLAIVLAPLWWLHARRQPRGVEQKRFPIFVLCALLLIVAGSRPYWSYEQEKKMVRGADLVILLDVSQSMFSAAGEGGLRRIDQARNFLRGLLPQFAGSSISVIYFAGDAQIGCPPTTDLSAVYLFLDSIAPAMTARPGTNPDSLQNALAGYLDSIDSSRLQNKRQQLGLLFSDGEFNSSSESLQAYVKKRKNFLLLSFACGKGNAAVPKYDLSGPYPGAMSLAQPMNVQNLATGRFYDLSQNQADTVGREVAGNVREIISGGMPAPKYRTIYFVALALISLLFYQLYPFLFRIDPAVAAGFYRIALILFLFASISMSNEDKSQTFTKAVQETRSNKLEDALRKLKILEASGASEEIEVAIGNVYYLQKNYDQSIAFYRKALERNPGNREARWNWEVALKRKQAPQNPPPPSPPQPQQTASQAPKEAEALLKYFEQQEKQQMQLTNSINAHTDKFAW